MSVAVRKQLALVTESTRQHKPLYRHHKAAQGLRGAAPRAHLLLISPRNLVVPAPGVRWSQCILFWFYFLSSFSS